MLLLLRALSLFEPLTQPAWAQHRRATEFVLEYFLEVMMVLILVVLLVLVAMILQSFSCS